MSIDLKMDWLDQYLLENVFNWLDDKSLVNVRSVSNMCQKILETDSFWNMRISRWLFDEDDISFRKPKQLYWKAQNTEMSDRSAGRMASTGDFDMLTILHAQGYRFDEYISGEELPRDQIIPLLSWMNDRNMINGNIWSIIVGLKYPKALDWLEENGFVLDPECSAYIGDLDTVNWFEDRNYPILNISDNAIWESNVELLNWCWERDFEIDYEVFLDWYYYFPIPFIGDFRVQLLLDDLELEVPYYQLILDLELIGPEHLKDLRKTLDVIYWLDQHTDIHVVDLGEPNYQYILWVLTSDGFKKYLF